MQPGWSSVSIMYIALCTHIYLCVYILPFIGESGDVFPNLAAGSHTMDARFTPDGFCRSAISLSLPFTIVSVPSPTGQITYLYLSQYVYSVSSKVYVLKHRQV